MRQPTSTTFLESLGIALRVSGGIVLAAALIAIVQVIMASEYLPTAGIRFLAMLFCLSCGLTFGVPLIAFGELVYFFVGMRREAQDYMIRTGPALERAATALEKLRPRTPA